ncbi:tetratricopeptide repeat protein [Paraburkholderia sp. J41]|uniref:tetratricopeptide repeat protein n=1 Tax=Paraburkholderia sp. J41 TaxID=2805433 RepID=UPI002AC35314|nr:tetratricopeptide repeat protein [Paraburkholderia sp. J41]
MTADSSRREIVPSTNRGDPPDFSQMESKQFEELTRAVLALEPDVKTAEMFHDDGEKQFGADSYGDLRGEFAIVVASSKCYGHVIPSEIKEWSDDFLKYYESFWKQRNVRRFILAVAAPVHRRATADAVFEQKQIFHERGMEYEVWGPRQFQDKLRFQRAIVGQYIGNYWANVICGDVPAGAHAIASDQSVLLEMLTTTVAPLVTALSTEVDSKLDALKARLREENPSSIVVELEKTRNGEAWSRLPAPVKSKCLRYLASAKLQEGNISAATEFADQADAFSADGALGFRALLTAHQGDHDRALQLLENTSEPNALEVKTALLLQAGRLDDAESILDRLPLVDGVPTIEVCRLRAYLLLFRGKRHAALAEIRRAESRAPRWFIVKRAGAVIRYANALSKVVGEEHFANPSPIAAELVRQDDASQALLDEALTTFASLAAEPGKPLGGSYDELWALACECNLVDGLSAAQTRCDRLLDADPASPEVISWALTRGLKFDRSRSREALRAFVEGDDKDANHVLAYSWLLTLDSNDVGAKDVLLQNEALFTSVAQRAAYEARVGFLEPPSGESISAPTPDKDGLERRIFAMVSDVSDSFAWTDLESLFASLAARDNCSVALLAAASRLAAAGRWAFLGRYVELLTKFETASAIEMAAHAAFNSGNAARALQVLQKNQTSFPHGKFPRNLAVIEAHSLADQGEHRKALKAAQALSSEFDGFRERMLPANIRLQIGDIRGAIPTIRDELSKKDLSAGDALRWSRFVALEDQDLARKLVKHAEESGLSEEFAVEAHMQATRLGMDKEAVVFQSTIATLMSRSSDGPFKMMNFEEFREFQAARVQARFNVWNLYLDGAIPFHVAAQPADIDFSVRYYIGHETSTDTNEWLPLMIRNGARDFDFDTGIALKDWRLYIDVSTLLLAKQLGVLETIESVVAAVIVPACLPSQLVTFGDSLEHPQPKRLEIERAIVEAFKTGAIRVWSQSRHTGTYLLPSESDDADMWMVVADETEPVPNGLHRATVACVLEGLRRAGRIDATQFQNAVSDLSPVSADLTIPPVGARLCFNEGTLATLTFRCSLQAILDTFAVFVDSDFAAVMTQTFRASRQRQEVLQVVNELRTHVVNQLLGDKYQTARRRTLRAEADATTGYPVQTQGLLELLRCEPDANAVFSCDDRYITGYPRFGTAPVVGIYELLRALRKSRALSDADYFMKLLHLRSANAMFLPVAAEEVLFHLRQAAIVDGEVVETHSLSVLRRYLARATLQERRLKIGAFPATNTDRPDEIHVFIATRRLTDECLTMVWTKKAHTDEQCVAWATWIWSELRMERPLGEHPSIRKDQDSLATFAAVTFSAALSAIIQLAIGHSESRKEAYSKWLNDRVIKNRFHNDQVLASHLVRQFAMLLDGLLAPDIPPKDKQVSDDIIAAYLRDGLELVPEELRDRLLGESSLRRALMTKIVKVTHIGDIQLLQSRFIPAVSRAIRQGKSQSKAYDSTDMVTFQPMEPPGAIAIEFNGRKAQINDPAFVIFACDDEGELRSFLNQHLAWFDRAPAESAKAMEAIVELKSGVKRYEALDEIRKRSLPFCYNDIEEQLNEHHSVPLTKCIPPESSQVFRHLRLKAQSTTFSLRWAEAAEALLHEYGLEETFLRLACLPVPLPQVFIERFASSSPEIQHSAYAAFAELGARSPLHFLHAFSLLKIQNLPSGVRALGSRMATDVLSRWDGLANAMGPLLMWSEIRAHEMQEWRSRSVEEQLVTTWYHAARLMCILNRNLDMETQIPKAFGKLRSSMSSDAAFGGLTRSLDCASPNNYVGVVLFYGGMNYALQGANAGSLQPPELLDQAIALTRVDNRVNPWLIASRELSPNCLDSFLQVHSATRAASPLLPATISEDFEQELIKGFESSPENPMLWVHLYTLTRMGLRAATRQRFVEIVAGANLIQLAAVQTEALIAWRCFAGCVKLLGECETQTSFRSQVFELAKNLSDRYEEDKTSIVIDGEDERAKRLNELLEACITFSRSDDVALAYSNVAELFSQVAAAWKPAKTAIRRTLESIYEESRISDNSAVWNAQIRLRAQT